MSAFRRTHLLLLIASLAIACTDRSPSAPPGEEPRAATVVIDPEQLEIELGDSAQLHLDVRAANGSALEGRPVTWVSSAPSVLAVNSSGLVRAVAAGSATITARVDGVQSTASLSALPWNVGDELVVVDSAVLRLVSDSAEMAAGQLRFEVLQGAPAPLDPGTVVVGTQGGGFLRRVTTSSLTGNVLTLGTETAALADVIEHGRFATSIDLLFDPGSSGQLGSQSAAVLPGTVVWGAGAFRNVASGMSVSVGGFDLSGLDVCKLIEDASEGATKCPEQLKKLEITTGRLDFTPALEMEAEFDGFALEYFRGVAKGALSLDLSLTVQAEGELGELKQDVTYFEFTRPFFMQVGPVPVVGYVEMALVGAVTVKATATASMVAGMQASSSVELGAEYSDDEWKAISTEDGSFDPAPPSLGDTTLAGAIQVEAKVSMKPRLQIIFYGVVGPFAEVEPFGSATLTLSTSACSLAGASGIDAAIGFTVPFLDDEIADFDESWTPLVSGPGSSWDCPLGFIDVSTTTNGAEVDTDGYQVAIDGRPRGGVGTTDHLLVPLVPVGTRTIKLDGVAPNCVVEDGVSRTVDVSTGSTQAVDYVVACSALVGDVEVSTATSGAAPDTDGYTITVDGVEVQAIAPNGTAMLSGIAGGTHSIGIVGLAPNCTVGGGNPVSVTVSSGARAAVHFEVSCRASELLVRTATNGPPATTSSWTVTLDDADPRSIAPDGSITYATTPEVHTVELSGLPENCDVSGDNPTTVTVAPDEPTEHVFAVECSSGSLTVEVSTETSDTTVTSFTATVNGQSKEVDINGSVSFSDVPEGSHLVGLLVPDNCTVDGQNPRPASVPGNVAFEVICQLPLECPVELPETSILDEIDVAYTEDGTWDAEIEAATFGHLAGNASSTAPPDLNGPLAAIYLEWHDYVYLVPVDSADIGRAAFLRAAVSGSITLRYSNPDNADIDVHYTAADVADRHEVRTGAEPGTYVVADTARYQASPGRWSRLDGGLYIFTGRGYDGETSAASGSLRLDHLIDVIDLYTGEPIPVRQICAASGTVYPSSGADEPE